MKDEKRFQYMGENRRGKVWAFAINEDPLEEVLIFYTPAGCVRGGDSHDHRQYNIVVRGTVKFYERYGPDTEVPGKGKESGEKVTYMHEGEMRIFEPGIPHWFVSLTDSWMIEWHERPRTKKVYPEYRNIIKAFEKMLDEKERKK